MLSWGLDEGLQDGSAQNEAGKQIQKPPSQMPRQIGEYEASAGTLPVISCEAELGLDQ